MSMDAGGLAQMSLSKNNSFASGRGLGAPTSSFSSRGKGNHLKRLSAAAPPKVDSISEHPANDSPTPRTSRSHLLAGLRTAPRNNSSSPAPHSAPYNNNNNNNTFGAQTFAPNNGRNPAVPHTAIASGFAVNQQSQFGYYALPEHVLAPPQVKLDTHDDGEMDPNLAAQLLATELYLQQRQQQLQQQLLSLQLAGMSLNGANARQQFPMTPMTPQTGFYAHQMQAAQDLSSLSVAYNPLTGQYQYVVNQDVQPPPQLSDSPPPPTPSFTNSPPKSATPALFRAQHVSPPKSATPALFRAQHVSPPSDVSATAFDSRSSTPPKARTPPADIAPLPPPSANAFRRGHRKNVSSLNLTGTDAVADGPKSAFVRPVGFPCTPMTGTFGPGQARAGEHPTRQPRGPPPLEELQAAPTAKHEGSKNFATRQRRSAVRNLVRAGIERRGVRSSGSGTPVSEIETSFPSSDNDSDSVRSGSLSGKPSIGSLRAAASGAIGSERQTLKERSMERKSSNEQSRSGSGERRRMPMLVLTSAEKRKSSMF